MQLPAELKSLYRHWEFHTGHNEPTLHPEQVFGDKELFENISWFIHERMKIWEKKVSKETPPFTSDPILSKYRFCNILREFDRQTIEFHRLLLPLRNDFPLWLLNMFYCRMVANTDTVRHTGLLSFGAIENVKFYERLAHAPRPRFGTPYVFPVSTILRSATPTREEFIAIFLPKIIPGIAKEIQTWNKLSVYDGAQQIVPLFGFNHNFLWTEVLIDVAYQFPEHIDLYKRFPVGPGALPTFKKIDKDADPTMLAERLAMMNFDIGLTHEGKPVRLSAENWEGIGCEYRKYINLRSGTGRRRIFTHKKTAHH